MKKTIKNRFNNTYYLLGVRKDDNKKVYLGDFSWDCSWYWGGGTVNGFTTNDIDGWEHIDSITQRSNKNMFDALKEYFSELVLTDKELWIFCDYMNTFYTLKEAAEVFHTGGSHYTTTDVSIKDTSIEKYINEKLLGKKIIPAIRQLLSK